MRAALDELQAITVFEFFRPPKPPESRPPTQQQAGAAHTWLLSSNDMVGLRRWASQLRRAHQQALLAMHHFSTMVLLDGWLEFKVLTPRHHRS